MPVTTKPSSIASRLKSFGALHAALTMPSAGPATAGPVLDATYRELFAHGAAELGMAKAEMISANTAHLGQLARIVDLKARRDRLTDALYSRFVKVRRLFEVHYGSNRRFSVLGISGATPADPTGLVAQVRDSAGFLREPKVTTPELDLLGVKLDPRAMATQLAAGADELDGVLAHVNEAEKRADVTRAAKNAAIGAYDEKFLRVARVAESVFRFAGMPELAARVRPSTRRPGRRFADERGQADTADQPVEAHTRPVEERPDASGEPAAPPVSAAAVNAGGRERGFEPHELFSRPLPPAPASRSTYRTRAPP